MPHRGTRDRADTAVRPYNWFRSRETELEEEASMSEPLTPENYRQRMAEIGQRDDLLYDQYGKHLEAEHFGEFVAICEDGRTILGTEDVTVSGKANEQFGRGRYAF